MICELCQERDTSNGFRKCGVCLVRQMPEEVGWLYQSHEEDLGSLDGEILILKDAVNRLRDEIAAMKKGTTE